ncbi:nicotinate-nucleotide adenylyltransferase [Aneurinibacillus terranovensis]|uniref:nicotinate-nucleotide adenylyltransferase n=1 Tax=Aneurinibacillus terranovensis TaxID=278991 RepID=UPI00055758FA|nr:nicotinate-nucleotide adenylyltransferase [Aneurinibacillus terranovensis]
MGGTFDPVHIVHLIVAEQAKSALGLDEIWFMPAHIPPHKRDQDITADHHRLAMLERAVAGNDSFRLTTVELDIAREDRPSYTYDTMLYLTNAFPDHTFYFIIGGDMVEYLPRWYKIDELVNLVQFAALARPGYTMNHPYGHHVTAIEMPQLDISSSMIREKIAKGQSVRYLIPDKVRLYIEENRLYGS